MCASNVRPIFVLVVATAFGGCGITLPDEDDLSITQTAGETTQGASTTATGSTGSSGNAETSRDGTTAQGSTSGASDSGPSTTTCPPNRVWAEPPGCPEGIIAPAVPAADCYVVCTVDQPDACESGLVCRTVAYNPCPCPDSQEICCDACAGTIDLCLPPRADPCDALVGQTFVSLDKQECGLTPDGVEMCRWEISFTADGTFAWQFSDAGERGQYICEDGLIEGGSYQGEFDPETMLLTWDGVTYQPSTR